MAYQLQMNSKKVLVIFGTRPEAIKMAPVIKALGCKENVEVRVCVTGQHREMLDQVLNLFKIEPDYDLNLMQVNQSLSQITTGVLSGLSKILVEWRPDQVLVHGDTTTTLAASLAAFYEKIPVGHVEAGLRTGNIYLPWPEEMNRVLTSSLATLHFAPTNSAKENLMREGISEENIFVTGNTVIDALLEVIQLLDLNKDLLSSLNQKFNFLNPDLPLLLVTGHRRENFGGGIEELCKALSTLSARGDMQIVYPVHLNPSVKAPVNEALRNQPGIFLIEPQEYLPFTYLMQRSFLIITDSGGIQEEAPSLNKPVLVTRSVTERPEALATGAIRLVGSNASEIIKNVEQLLDHPKEYGMMSSGSQNPYGDGKAAQRIAEIIARKF